MGWARRPRFFMDLPLLFLFLGALTAEDLVQIGLSLGPGLALAMEEVGLTKGPALLMMDCCQTSSADHSTTVSFSTFSSVIEEFTLYHFCICIVKKWSI